MCVCLGRGEECACGCVCLWPSREANLFQVKVELSGLASKTVAPQIKVFKLSLLSSSEPSFRRPGNAIFLLLDSEW